MEIDLLFNQNIQDINLLSEMQQQNISEEFPKNFSNSFFLTLQH